MKKKQTVFSIVIPLYNLDEFAEKVIRFINDNKVLDKYSRDCCKFIEENCSEKMVAEEYCLIYKKHAENEMYGDLIDEKKY